MDTQHANVAELAYQLWHERGCPVGSPEIDWREAERRLLQDGTTTAFALSAKVDESTKDTFPASDPPASHGADNPPSNAGDKWKAAAAKSNAAAKDDPAAHRPNGQRPHREGVSGA